MTVATVVAALAVVTAAGASLNTHLVRVERAARVPVGGKRLGAEAASATQSGIVVLKPSSESALKKFIAGVSTPHSATYHHYLKAGQFAKKFGPGAGTIKAVKTQLTDDGLKVTSVSRNGLLINFRGSTAKVESAFSTRLERYRTAAGVTGEETTKAIKLPSSVSRYVSAVLGLNTLIHPEQDYVRAPKSAFAGHAAARTAVIHHTSGAPDPCPDAEGAATEYGGLTDDQVGNAYGATSEYATGDTGAGVHIGVYELEPFSTTDLKTFDTCYYGATKAATMIANVDTVNVDGGNPSGPGSGESILDVEDVAALAPGADIDVYEAPNSTAGSLDEYGQMVDNDRDQIISSSWGECEQDVEQFEPGDQQAENYIFEQAAAQGQTVLSAAGDTGDDTCNEIRSTPPPTDQNPLSVNDPSSQPYVLAVGGTTIQDADPAHYDETTWNDGANWGGGGGGLSMTWSAPGWQQLTAGFPNPGGGDYTAANSVESNAESLGVSDKDWTPGFCANNATADYASGTPCRALPDVSAQADEFTGAVTIYSSSFGKGAAGWITIGGTSSATPIWAALLALVDSSASCQTDGDAIVENSHDFTGGIGFANPLLYAVADNPTEYAESFHDITVGNNDVYGLDNGKVFPATTGYDLATGLGSPILATGTTPGLAANLCALASPTTVIHPVITGRNTTDGPLSGGNTLILIGSGFAPGGGVTVSSVTVGDDALSSSQFTVESNTNIQIKMPPAKATLAAASTGGSTGAQDGAGPANVVLTLSNGISSAIGDASQYAYVDESNTDATVPSVSAVAPYAGLESDPSQVTVYGSGFDPTGDTIQFGDETPVTSYTYVKPWEIKVTPPVYSKPADCVTSAAITTETAALGENNGAGDTNPAADDICQTNVTVTNANGTSAKDTPLPTYEGPAPKTNQDGSPLIPAGFELSPTATEYDYTPTPAITSVSTATPATYADAYGGSVVTLNGTGLNNQTLYYTEFGDPSKASSMDYELESYTGTSLTVMAPGDTTTGKVGPNTVGVPVGVNTISGQSAAGQDATYAGIPTVTSVSTGTTDAKLSGLAVSPDSGGANLTITGTGFTDAIGPVVFEDAYSEFSNATQYSFDATSATQITTQTLSENPAIVDTLVCTTSGCSIASSEAVKPSKADLVLLYPPGKPVISAIANGSGPADGGTLVTIEGENLGCATSVKFGSTNATIVPTSGLLDCGSTAAVTVIAPKGVLGKSVPITLTTVESDVSTPATSVTSPTDFKYTKNPSVTPAKLAFGSVKVGHSVLKTATVHNPGSGLLDLGKPVLSGKGASSFAIAKDTCAKATVKAGGTCTVQVRYSAHAKGAASAELEIEFNAALVDIKVPLSGTGK